MSFFEQNEDARNSKKTLDVMISYNRMNNNYVTRKINFSINHG